MRFFFISTMLDYPWGGSEELWSQAALRLHQAGHDVGASVPWFPQLSPKVTALADQGIQLFIQPPLQASVPVRVWRKIMRDMGVKRTEFRRLQRQKPDLVVISQGGNSDGLRWMKFCRDAGLPFVVIVQCNADNCWPKDDEGVEMERAYRVARKVFCVSRHNLKLLECQIGGLLPNAEVVWNPFNVAADQPPAWPKATGVWKLACVARLEPAAKGQDLLFQVLAQPRWRDRQIGRA